MICDLYYLPTHFSFPLKCGTSLVTNSQDLTDSRLHVSSGLSYTATDLGHQWHDDTIIAWHLTFSPLVIADLLALPDPAPSWAAQLHRGQSALGYWLVLEPGLMSSKILERIVSYDNFWPSSEWSSSAWWQGSTADWWCSPLSHSHISRERILKWE